MEKEAMYITAISALSTALVFVVGLLVRLFFRLEKRNTEFLKYCQRKKN